MKGKTKGALITFAAIVIIVLLSMYAGYSFGSKETSIRYSDNVAELQRQNRELKGSLIQAEGTVNSITDSIVSASERIGTINTGIGNGIDTVDAIIRIAEELGSLISEIEYTIKGYDEKASP